MTDEPIKGFICGRKGTIAKPLSEKAIKVIEELFAEMELEKSESNTVQSDHQTTKQ